jgi:hypothetical protein
MRYRFTFLKLIVCLLLVGNALGGALENVIQRLEANRTNDTIAVGVRVLDKTQSKFMKAAILDVLKAAARSEAKKARSTPKYIPPPRFGPSLAIYGHDSPPPTTGMYSNNAPCIWSIYVFERSGLYVSDESSKGEVLAVFINTGKGADRLLVKYKSITLEKR